MYTSMSLDFLAFQLPNYFFFSARPTGVLSGPLSWRLRAIFCASLPPSPFPTHALAASTWTGLPRNLLSLSRVTIVNKPDQLAVSFCPLTLCATRLCALTFPPGKLSFSQQTFSACAPGPIIANCAMFGGIGR